MIVREERYKEIDHDDHARKTINRAVRILVELDECSHHEAMDYIPKDVLISILSCYITHNLELIRTYYRYFDAAMANLGGRDPARDFVLKDYSNSIISLCSEVSLNAEGLYQAFGLPLHDSINFALDCEWSILFAFWM